MQVQFKKLTATAVAPSKAHPRDAGFDLTATSISTNPVKGYIEYGTGIAVNIPSGYVGLLFPRSSVSNTTLSLSNSVGVIDSGYTGEIKFRFRRSISWLDTEDYKVGDRVGQLVIMPIPEIKMEEVADFPITDRGEKGFGSTNKQPA